MYRVPDMSSRDQKEEANLCRGEGSFQDGVLHMRQNEMVHLPQLPSQAVLLVGGEVDHR